MIDAGRPGDAQSCVWGVRPKPEARRLRVATEWREGGQAGLTVDITFSTVSPFRFRLTLPRSARLHPVSGSFHSPACSGLRSFRAATLVSSSQCQPWARHPSLVAGEEAGQGANSRKLANVRDPQGTDAHRPAGNGWHGDRPRWTMARCSKLGYRDGLFSGFAHGPFAITSFVDFFLPAIHPISNPATARHEPS